MNPLIETLGWTLIHFLWQASIVTAVLWIALRFVRPSRWRYLLSGGALLVMLGGAAITAIQYWPERSVAKNAVSKASIPVAAEVAAAPDPSPAPELDAPLDRASETNPATPPPASPIASLEKETGTDAGMQAWLPWVVALWATGVAVLSFNFLRSWRALRRLRSGASPLTDLNTRTVFERLLRKMGLHRPVALLCTTETAVPLVVGWLRPAVIIPAALFARMPAWQIEAILAHELAHVRRHDYLVNLLQNVVETIFFYHPAVWWVSSQLRNEREHCCDDTAAATCGNVLEYARALTALEETRDQVPAGALSASGGSLLGRIRRLLGVPVRDPGSVFTWPAGLAISLLTVGLLAGAHFVQGEEPNDDKDKDKTGESVRGVLLDGLPQTDDVTTFADLYEADPDDPGEVRQKEGVFFMSLGHVGPWLYYPSNGVHFYLKVRPDPDIIEDVVYGPIPGNPVEKLDLPGWLRDSPNHRDPGYARRVVRNMIRCGDKSLAKVTVDWFDEFPPPSPPGEYDEYIDLMARHTPDRFRALREKFLQLREESNIAWDKKRKHLPDSDYQPGEDPGPEHEGIHWYESSGEDLRLGFTSKGDWKMGETISFNVFVRNDGKKPVRFAWTGRMDEDFSAVLVDAAGKEHRAEIAIFDILIFHNRSRLEPGQILKVMYDAELAIGTPEDKGVLNYFPIAKGGDYKLRIRCDLGIEDWSGENGIEVVRPAGEWEGTLQSEPIPVSVTNGVAAAKADDPGSKINAKAKHSETGLLLEKWRAEFPDVEEIPAAPMKRLAEKVRDFVKNSPDQAEALSAILPKLEEERDWSWTDATAMVDAVCDISTSPVSWLDLDEKFRAFERVKAGEKWPAEKLAGLPFGAPAESGLRVAWIFDPMKAEYHVGEVLKCRIIFHNSGEEPVEFVTDQWHQNDTWHVTDPDGKEIATSGSWFTGITPYQRYRLAPGETCEVAGHGLGIGVAEFAESTSQALVGREILAEPGEEVRCKWDVSLGSASTQPTSVEDTKLTTGEVRFRVLEALPLGERPPGVTKSTGGYDLGLGVHLNITTIIGRVEGFENLAWITWEKESGALGDGKAGIVLPQSDDPRDYSVPTFIWPQGGSTVWIVQPDKLRKIDFSKVGELVEESWNWEEAPVDFGGADEKVQAEIEKNKPAGNKTTSYLERSVKDWDAMLGSGGIRSDDREALTALGYGTADVPVPDEAIPMLLALVKSGQGATKCRCLGTLKKLENPNDTVLDTVIDALTDEKSKGNRYRAGYLLGDYKKRSDYTVPRLLPLIRKTGSLDQSAAVFALGRIGPAAKEAIPALEAIRPGAPEDLMKVIDSAIKSIRDNPPQDDDAKAQEEGILIMANDADTGAPIDEFRVLAGVPSSVSRQFEKGHNTAVVNWQSHTIKLGRDGEFTWPANRGYAKMSLRIEADGYVPQVIHGLKKGMQEIFALELKRDAGIAGSVQTPGGRRAAHDATVVLAMIRRNARLKGSTFPELALGKGDSLRDQWDRPTVVQPDDQGRFTLPNEPDPTAVVLIVHGDGVFVQPFAEWKKSTHVLLEPWGRIHGAVRWGGDRVGAGEKVDLSVNRGDAYGYPDIVAQYDETVANDKGRFVFERVLPGMAQLSCPIEYDAGDGKKSSTYVEGRITHADIAAPHTSVVIGGKGRTVKGRLTGFDNLEGITFRVHPNAPPIGDPGDEQLWAAWSAFKQSPSGASYFRDGLKVAGDGTFEITGMLPGYYQIFFSQKGGKSNAANGVFRLPKEDWEGNAKPFDAGEFKAR